MCIAIKSYEYCFLSQSMQRRDSLGSTNKIPRLSKGSTRKFKTRRSQSSFSSASDVFAGTESTKGQPDLSVSKMKLRSEKNLDGDQRMNFTPCRRNDMSRKASSASPTRPMSDGITMGTSSTFDRLMMSMSKQKGGASSSTRL